MTEEHLEFKTEVNRLLDLVIHSLYSHKEIFLRELISNASDAIDKARYESLTNGAILEDGAGDWKIKLTPDKAAGTLTVSDDGIGMDREEVVRELGTIAHSGTKEFLAALKDKDIKDNPELIGQFGVGFYSAFMVADKVAVLTRKAGAGDTQATRWESEGKGSFTVTGAQKDSRGTDVILHLKEEEKKYLEEWELRTTVKKYSDYIEHPIVLEVEREKESTIDKSTKVKVKEEETLNSQKAIWLKDKADISEEEYNEFYKHLSHDYTNPSRVIHYRAEGTSEFTALLYIPSHLPFDIFFKEYKTGPALYVKRVQIMDHCEELLPRYLRFVKGVVDSSDLPLNVSRELLQNNRQIDVINKSVTKKTLDTLSDMKKNDYDKYVTFYEEFGKVLKEGIHFDFTRKEAIADLILFHSTTTETGKYTTLKDYVERMKEGQEAVYYITGQYLDDLAKSPFLESFRDKGYEVLFMIDEIDDIVFGSFEYGGKQLKSVVRGDISLDKSTEEEKKKSVQKYRDLLDVLKDRLKDDVKDVRLSGRLKDSPCCLVADEGAMDPNMERLLRSMGQSVPATKRILELNPAHPLIEAMKAMFDTDKKNPKLENYADLLYEQALLLEGGKPKDPAAFAQALTRLMMDNAGEQEKMVS